MSGKNREKPLKTDERSAVARLWGSCWTSPAELHPRQAPASWDVNVRHPAAHVDDLLAAPRQRVRQLGTGGTRAPRLRRHAWVHQPAMSALPARGGLRGRQLRGGRPTGAAAGHGRAETAQGARMTLEQAALTSFRPMERIKQAGQGLAYCEESLRWYRRSEPEESTSHG